MANSGIITPAGVDELINNRANIWEWVDRAGESKSRLETLGRPLGTTGAASALPPLVDAQNPPAELLEAVRRLETELATIERAEAQIAAHQAEIERLKKQKTLFIIGAVVAGVIVLLILIAYLSS